MNRETTTISCLDTVLQEVRSMELTQQLKLPDGMGDVGRILAAWGQVILRSKEWRDEEVSISGGMMVWILYALEDGGEAACIDTWLPFQMEWDLPDDVPEGKLRIRCLTRFVDGRSVSPRKIMVRCGVSVMAEAFVPVVREAALPAVSSEAVELLRNTYPLRIPKEAGEKVFLLDEDLTVPDSVPQPEKLIYSRMEPRITDCRVLADKLAFRGNGNLHLLYRSEEGQLHSWDFPLHFSQIAELDREYGSEAQADMAPTVTSLEAELDDEGHIRVKCGIAGQYHITDRQLVTVVEDAYSPDWELSMETGTLQLPVILENRRENLTAEQTVPMDANLTVDVTFLPDFPKQRHSDQRLELEYSGTFQALSYGQDGVLQGANARWETRQQLNVDGHSEVAAIPLPGEPQTMENGGQLDLKAELPVELTTTARQQIPMVTNVELGQRKKPDPDRPTLILRRAGDKRLWDIAKASGSRMEDIRQANGLLGEPAPDQMLLIPVH